MNRAFLASLFHHAVHAATPAKVIGSHLPEKPKGRTTVIGASKASAQMAAAFEEAWGEPASGLVVTRYGHGCPTRWIEVTEARHPVPDRAGQEAARRLMEMVQGLGADDLVVALISGGGSALLPAPGPGMTLADEEGVTSMLLASGMPISAMNRVRNELSASKGGRLAALAAPARVVTLVISDVPGDDPALIASGSTLPRKSSRDEVRALVRDHGLHLPLSAAKLLGSDVNLPPAPEALRFARNTVSVIASATISLEAAANFARSRGIATSIFSDSIEGESREVARTFAAIAREVKTKDRPFAKPVLLLSGGETTVTVKGHGRGGRNAEFLLASALAIAGVPGISAMAGDTDGIDGLESNAGAFADGNSTRRMRAAGVDPVAALFRNDAYTAFEAVDDLLVTGPTGTNVNDFRAIFIE